jgi:hypothetical protein
VQWDIWLFVGLALASMLASFTDLARPGRIALGLPVVLLGQGYVALAALFDDSELESGLRVMLVLALSLSIGVLGVLALYAVGAPIRDRPVAAMELVIIVAFAAAALYRRVRRHRQAPVWIRPSAAHIVPLAAVSIIALAVVAGILVLSRPIPDSHVAGYAYVGAVRGAHGEIALDVRNEQTVSGRFTVVATAGARKFGLSTFTLGAGGTWRRTLQAPGPPLQDVVISLHGELRGHSIDHELLLRG